LFTQISGSSQSSFHSQPTITRQGRKYINDPTLPYPLPVDIAELNRQNLLHLLFREVFGSYYTANFGTKRSEIPIPNKVLDLGCGTGCWSASMADELASKFGKRDTEFVGLDLVQCQPDLPGVNWKFVQHNFLEERLPFEKNTFDMVFLRELTMCIPNNIKLTNILSDCIRVLKPGGVLEIQCSKCLFEFSLLFNYWIWGQNTDMKTTTPQPI
jgi:SAM-dependent methyltransferase